MSNQGKKVKTHYRGTLDDGTQFDSSYDRGEPLEFTCGAGQMIKGFDAAVIDMQVGEKKSVHIPAADAYGERRDGLTQRVPKKHFGEQKLTPGMQVVLQTNFGPRAVTIEKVGMSVVDVDLNHPMAGKDLSFDIDIVEVREASEEELAHGHVHGEGGHQH